MFWCQNMIPPLYIGLDRFKYLISTPHLFITGAGFQWESFISKGATTSKLSHRPSTNLNDIPTIFTNSNKQQCFLYSSAVLGYHG